jgi:hypothetical protein
MVQHLDERYFQLNLLKRHLHGQHGGRLKSEEKNPWISIDERGVLEAVQSLSTQAWIKSFGIPLSN